MKRVGLIGLSLSMIFLLTGCGEKSLECSMTEDNMTQAFNLKFDSKDMLESGVMRFTFKLEDDELDTLDEGVEALRETFENNSEYDAFDISVTDNGKDEAYVDMSFSADQISEVTGEDLDPETDNYDSIKADLEDTGYVCK